jgi:ABC-type transporter Mla MlaB component
MPKMVAPPATSMALPKPKAATKPQPQKNYALLSDIQIAGIKERLKLSSAQESYWPPVETALRAVARKIHSTRQANPNAAGMPIDPDAEEVQQLKSAAMPLLFQLREDQKSEVRSLARIIGLEKVASMI